MDAERRVLVVGGDSTIGLAIAARLLADGINVVRTSRRAATGSMHLDLTDVPRNWTPPPSTHAAVLCAAITSNQECRGRPDYCRRVNVEATITLGRRMLDAGARVLFLSTNMVFDGSIPFTPATSSPSPRTAYGRLKAEAEEGLLALNGDVTIVRLTKVVPPSFGLFQKWRNMLRNGEPIEPLVDYLMAPLTLDFAAATIAKATYEPTGRILQLSASADISYADAARQLAEHWNAPSNLVRSRCVAETDLEVEHNPPHTTLDGSSLQRTLNIQQPAPMVAITAAAR